MTVLLAGDHWGNCERRVLAAVARTGRVVRMERRLETALRSAETNPPSCIVLHADTLGAWWFAAELRAKPALHMVPLLVLTDRATTDSFREANDLGADEIVLTADAEGLTRRISNVPATPAQRPSTAGRRCWILHGDAGRRGAIGRAMRLAGFETGFASTIEELSQLTRFVPAPDVVVFAEAKSLDEQTDAIDSVRSMLNRPLLPCVAAVDRDPTERLSTVPGALQNVAFHRDGNDGTDVLFHANQLLLSAAAAGARTARRLLYRSLSVHQTLGSEHSDYGLIYNVSRGGLYIRTFSPPERNTIVELTIRPPASDRDVTLFGRVVWVRNAASNGAATSPAGFGIELLPDYCDASELTAYKAGVIRAESLTPELPITPEAPATEQPSTPAPSVNTVAA